jgi:hypothetical protein
MKYKIVVFSVFLVFFILLGFFTHQGMMLYRYKQIKQEVFAYQEAEKTSYSEALEHYQKANNLLSYYFKSFPTSVLLRSIDKQKELLGGIDLEKYYKIEPILSSYSKAEKDLLACSWLLAKSLDEYDETYGYEGRIIQDQMKLEVDMDNMYCTLSPVDLVKSNIAYQLAKTGHFDLAQQTIMQFTKESSLVRLSLLSKFAQKSNNKEIAKNILDSAFQLIQKSDFSPADVADGLYFISQEYKNMGLTKEMIDTLKKLTQRFDNLKDSLSNYLLSNELLKLIDDSMQLKQNETAITLIKSYTMQYQHYSDIFAYHEEEIPNVAKVIIYLETLKQADLLNEVMQYYKGYVSETMLYISLASLYYKNQPAKAIEFLQKAKKMIGDFSDSATRIQYNLQLAEMYYENKMDNELISVIRDILSYLSDNELKNKEKWTNSNVFINVINTLLMLKKPDEAYQAFVKMPNYPYPNYNKDQGLYKIASYYLKQGNIEKTIQLTDKMVDDGIRHPNYRSNTYYDIAKKYFEKKDLDRAIFYINHANPGYESKFYLESAEEAIKTNQISKAKEYFQKFFKEFDNGGYRIPFYTDDEICGKIAGIITQIEDETLIKKVLNDRRLDYEQFMYALDKNSLIYAMASEYSKQNKEEEFKKYYQEITDIYQKKRILLEVFTPPSTEKMMSFSYQEAIKTDNKAVLSLYLSNQAKQLIEKKEYEKVLAMVEKIDLNVDKATVLTLLVIHWEKPNLSGANAVTMHRIVAACSN